MVKLSTSNKQLNEVVAECMVQFVGWLLLKFLKSFGYKRFTQKKQYQFFTMRPSTMPKLSFMTLARGARQLVVQEALLWRKHMST